MILYFPNTCNFPSWYGLHSPLFLLMRESPLRFAAVRNQLSLSWHFIWLILLPSVKQGNGRAYNNRKGYFYS